MIRLHLLSLEQTTQHNQVHSYMKARQERWLLWSKSNPHIQIASDIIHEGIIVLPSVYYAHVTFMHQHEWTPPKK